MCYTLVLPINQKTIKEGKNYVWGTAITHSRPKRTNHLRLYNITKTRQTRIQNSTDPIFSAKLLGPWTWKWGAISTSTYCPLCVPNTFKRWGWIWMFDACWDTKDSKFYFVISNKENQVQSFSLCCLPHPHPQESKLQPQGPQHPCNPLMSSLKGWKITESTKSPDKSQ